MQASNAKPSDRELAREVRNFEGNLTLQPNLWTVDDLKDDFKRLRGNDYLDFASSAVGKGAKVILPLLSQPGGAVFNLLDKAKDFLADKAKESIAGHIADISLQPLMEGESKSTKEFVSEMGSTILMGTFVTLTTGHLPGALVAGALFTIVIYLYKSEKELQKKADDKLAEKLWETWEKTREKSQAKLDAKNQKEIEQFLLSSWAQDEFDEQTLLKYQHTEFGLLNVKRSNSISLLENVPTGGSLPSEHHAAKAFAVFQIIPGHETRLDENERREVGNWLRKLVQAENKKKITAIRRLMAGEEYDEDMDERNA
jgi:hypothetical protein